MTPPPFRKHSPHFLFSSISSWFGWLFGGLWAVVFVYGAIWVDFRSRAEASYRDGERYLQWARNPAERTRHQEAEYLKESERLFSLQERGKLTPEDLRLEQDVLQSRFDLIGADSSAKRAYFSFRDAHRYSSHLKIDDGLKARLLEPVAKHVWREEVFRQGLSVPGEMFDPAPGETGDRRLVFSTPDPNEAALLFHLLMKKGVLVRVFDDKRIRGAVREGFWLTVPSASFWKAHETLRAFLAPDLPVVLGEVSSSL